MSQAVKLLVYVQEIKGLNLCRNANYHNRLIQLQAGNYQDYNIGTLSNWDIAVTTIYMYIYIYIHIQT